MTTESSKTEVGSYFISNYPPYSQWNRDALEELRKALSQPPAPVPLGLYLHIPFCRKRCKFCYFKVFTDNRASDIEKYVMGERPFRFVYFGGGTPSYLSVRQLESLVDRLRQSIDWSLAEEVTFECEPGTLKESKVRALKELGVTRLSLGVENFSDEVLKENGRAHLTAEIDLAWEWIQAAEFHNVNIDLIAGMVGETWDNWKYNIQRAIELSPDSVTMYQLELPYNTVYSKDILGNQVELPVADWPTKRDWVNYAFDEFLKAGYHVNSAYTVVKDPKKVNFSYRDNLWHGSDLLATGIASFGHVSGVHYQNKPEWDDYIGDLLDKEELPLGRAYRPTQYQLLIRELILQLKKGAIPVDYFQDKFGVNILEEWSEVWERYVEEGFVETDAHQVRLTRQGLLRADGLLPAFFESHHQGVRYT
jgi:oxygen-independent coproporphyrinogen-3 oxidase